MTFGHDTLMGILLALAGIFAIGYAMTGERTWRSLSIIGAVVAIVIGVLLFFGLA